MLFLHYDLLKTSEELESAEVPRELIDFLEGLSVVVSNLLGWIVFKLSLTILMHFWLSY